MREENLRFNNDIHYLENVIFIMGRSNNYSVDDTISVSYNKKRLELLHLH
jgi:hypothetical protein